MDNEGIFTTSFQAGRKRIYVDVKDNDAGTYLKIKTERNLNATRRTELHPHSERVHRGAAQGRAVELLTRARPCRPWALDRRTRARAAAGATCSASATWVYLNRSDGVVANNSHHPLHGASWKGASASCHLKGDGAPDKVCRHRSASARALVTPAISQPPLRDEPQLRHDRGGRLRRPLRKFLDLHAKVGGAGDASDEPARAAGGSGRDRPRARPSSSTATEEELRRRGARSGARSSTGVDLRVRAAAALETLGRRRVPLLDSDRRRPR